jgi:hypothetical protein
LVVARVTNFQGGLDTPSTAEAKNIYKQDRALMRARTLAGLEAPAYQIRINKDTEDPAEPDETDEGE